MTATYTCQKCKMTVNTTCANCSDEPLVNDSLDSNGTKIQISKCPKCQGKIKSPMCCGQDMNASYNTYFFSSSSNSADSWEFGTLLLLRRERAMTIFYFTANFFHFFFKNTCMP